jgi:hypothetical protein
MRNRFHVFLLSSLFLVSTCNDDGGTPTEVNPTIRQLAECTCPNVESFIGVFAAVVDLRDVVEDPQNPPGSVESYSSATGDFSIFIDLDDNGMPEGKLTGSIRNPQNFDDGIDINEAIVADWDLVFNNMTGSGICSTVRLGGSSYRVTIVESNPTFQGGACGFEITSLGLHFDTTNLDTRGPWGSMEFVTDNDEDSLQGLMTFAQDDDLDSVSASHNDERIDFKVNLHTFEIVW